MDTTHIRWLEERLEKYSVKDPKGRKWKKNRRRQREHDRKQEPKRALVVPTR
jgi:hypothetical protein